MLFFEVAGLNDIETAFATATRLHVGVLVLHADPFFNGHRDEIIALAAHHAVPTFYELRDFVTAGGLISYGASLANAYRQAGTYVGRILKGEKAGDLPMTAIKPVRACDQPQNRQGSRPHSTRQASVAADEVIE